MKDRLQALPAALSEDELLAAIVDGSQDAIIACDLAGLILSWNPAAQSIFGYTEREVLGKHIQQIVPLDRKRLQHEVFSEVFAGRRVEHYETKSQFKGGGTGSVSLNVSPLAGHNGEIVGACAIVRDISARIELEAERERLRVALELSHQALVHDIKGPLGMTRAMIAEAGSLVAEDDDESSKYLDLASNCVAHLQLLVTDVALLHTVYNRSNCQPIDLASLVHSAADSIPGVCVEVGNLPPVIVAHEHAMQRMFRNIFENASKYASDANGVARVSISGGANETHWLLEIDDRGPGIPEADLPHVFEPFYRGSERSNPDGTGLGLAIVSACAEAHGGTASIANLEEGGLGLTISVLKAT